MTDAQRRWLTRAAIWIAIAVCTKRGAVTLTDLRDEIDGLGLLDRPVRRGDIWLLDVARLGPFDRGPDGVLVLVRDVPLEGFDRPAGPFP